MYCEDIFRIILNQNCRLFLIRLTRKLLPSEREILYKILFDMRNDMNDLKKYVHENMHQVLPNPEVHSRKPHVIPKFVHDVEPIIPEEKQNRKFDIPRETIDDIQDTQEIIEESLSLSDKEIELIRKALGKTWRKTEICRS